MTPVLFSLSHSSPTCCVCVSYSQLLNLLMTSIIIHWNQSQKKVDMYFVVGIVGYIPCSIHVILFVVCYHFIHLHPKDDIFGIFFLFCSDKYSCTHQYTLPKSLTNRATQPGIDPWLSLRKRRCLTTEPSMDFEPLLIPFLFILIVRELGQPYSTKKPLSE